MRIVVLIKYVPQVDSDMQLTPDHTVLRAPATGTLNELDEHAIEAALLLAAADDSAATVETTTGEPSPTVIAGSTRNPTASDPPAPSEVIAVAMAPEIGDLAVRKAFQLGVDRGVRITDDGLAGSDTFGTTSVLAAAIRKLGAERPVDLVVAGMASSDAAGAVVPALLAYDLGWPSLTFAESVRLAGDASIPSAEIEITRSVDDAVETLRAPLPAVLSVTDSANTVRTPNFKLIMAARTKPIETWSIADLDVDETVVGSGAARSVVVSSQRVPDKPAPPVITDDGEGSGAQALVDFLVEKELI